MHDFKTLEEEHDDRMQQRLRLLDSRITGLLERTDRISRIINPTNGTSDSSTTSREMAQCSNQARDTSSTDLFASDDSGSTLILEENKPPKTETTSGK